MPMLVCGLMKPVMVGVAVGVTVGVGVAVVSVLKHMGVFVRMHFAKCFQHHKDGARNHDDEGNQEIACQLFAENHEREESASKGTAFF